MAKVKKHKHLKRREDGTPRRFGGIALPESALRMIWGIAMFTAALIFVFAFFQNAGIAGDFFLRTFQLFVGKAAFFAPFLFVLAGAVFFGMREFSVWTVFATLIFLLAGMSGMFAVVARGNHLDIQQVAGLLGFAVSAPIVGAFGIWVGGIILAATLLASLAVFWHLIEHEYSEGLGAAGGAQEKIRKIFEPKFEVKELEPEPKIRNAMSAEAEKPQAQKTGSSKQKKFEPIPAMAGDYKFPPADLLEEDKGIPNAGDIKIYSSIIKKTLQHFDIPVELSEVNIGPAVTQYAIKPAEGIKLSRITALQADLSLALAAHPIRIEAPIPGRALVGIEIPNKIRATVRLRGLIESQPFKESHSSLLIALGKDVSGSPIFTDLAKMPHMLVAGATGSGKTIGLNNIILSLVYRNSPNTLRFILVDPKRVEFPVYNDLPHLLTPVILENQKVLNVLKWLIKEMERRFQALSQVRARDIGSYHALYREKAKEAAGEDEWETMPYIVVVIDELADLMASRGKELEGMIVRLAQMARAVGIHLVLATQRPSVEVITGLIKANVTARVAFQVASQVDSRTILDSAGAEKLLGQGDMLFLSTEFSKPKRVQGAYVSDKDVKKVVAWIAQENERVARQDIEEDELSQSAMEGMENIGAGGTSEEDDPLYEEAKHVVVESKRASASLLQRRLKLGYARAARLLDMMEERGVVGPGEGAKPREVYMKSGHVEEEDGTQSEWTSPKL
ncbi:MAG: DNA translocase FtsK [Candidatus Wildermuthbacteria bacterium]|nr:DNA translocase FtsK [Candidatus Wildermuthbacteria bacterium]